MEGQRKAGRLLREQQRMIEWDDCTEVKPFRIKEEYEMTHQCFPSQQVPP